MISLRSEITKKLLKFFFLNPHKKLYLNELARALDCDRGNLTRKLREMEKEGLLISEFTGPLHYYKLNGHFPLLKAYKDIFRQTLGPEAELRAVFSKLKGVDHLYIFGSYASDKLRPASDIDLLFVGTASHIQITKTILDLQKTWGRVINIVDMSPNEFREKLKNKDALLSDIFRKPYIEVI
jgi:predicted nucleotidyltransferase